MDWKWNEWNGERERKRESKRASEGNWICNAEKNVHRVRGKLQRTRIRVYFKIKGLRMKIKLTDYISDYSLFSLISLLKFHTRCIYCDMPFNCSMQFNTHTHMQNERIFVCGYYFNIIFTLTLHATAEHYLNPTGILMNKKITRNLRYSVLKWFYFCSS